MMRCFPAAAFCLFLFASQSHADAPASSSLPVTVCDRGGAPLVGVRLALQPSGRVVITDSKGAAVFTSLPPGSYTVSLAPPSYFPLSQTITLTANASSSMGFVLERNGASSVTTHSAAGTDYRINVPPVPRPVNPLPEYLLTPPVPPGSGPGWRTAQENTLREAMFRYLINNLNGPDRAKHFPVCYISIENGKDPNPAFLRRFRGSKPPMQAASHLFPATNKNWVLFGISSFQWTDDRNLKIETVGSGSGALSSFYNTLTLTLRNGWWEIVGSLGVSG